MTESDQPKPVLTGATAIGRTIDVCGKTICRWYEAGLLAGIVWKGPTRNSPLKCKRADVPKLKQLASAEEVQRD